VRDVVKFVRLADFPESDNWKLAEEVLKEIPEQLVNYMVLKGI